MAQVTSTDIHFMFRYCRCQEELLTSGKLAVEVIADAVRNSGLTVVETCSKEFDNGGGVTAAVLLLESHVIIHTWPDRDDTVIGDISVCNYSQNNAEKAKNLQEALRKVFAPEQVVGGVMYSPTLTEDIDLSRGYDIKSSLEFDTLLEHRTSPYQDIKVVENQQYGRVLVLDTVFQTSERDEFFYHEPLVHVPMLAHPNPEEVLIVGGGDAGAAEEVLKHSSVKNCTMVELDRDVVELSQTYLGKIHRDVFHDRRFELRVEDGFKYLINSGKEYDVIILDLTDPVGEAAPLFSQRFYQASRDHLAPGGFLSLHMGMVTHDPPASAGLFNELRKVYPDSRPYLNFIPIYGGVIGFILCGKVNNIPGAAEVDQRIQERKIADLQFLNGEIYQSLFALPNYLKKVLGI